MCVCVCVCIYIYIYIYIHIGTQSVVTCTYPQMVGDTHGNVCSSHTGIYLCNVHCVTGCMGGGIHTSSSRLCFRCSLNLSNFSFGGSNRRVCSRVFSCAACHLAGAIRGSSFTCASTLRVYSCFKKIGTWDKNSDDKHAYFLGINCSTYSLVILVRGPDVFPFIFPAATQNRQEEHLRLNGSNASKIKNMTLVTRHCLP